MTSALPQFHCGLVWKIHVEKKKSSPLAAKATAAGRRKLLLGFSSAAVSLTGVRVAQGEQVRLEDVESPKLQEAIRAAVYGELDLAERLFTELLEEDDKSASVWSNRGNVRISLQRYEEAIDDFNKAVMLAPEAPVPLLNRAIAEEALGRYDDAIADCQAAIKLDPQEYAAWYNLGNVDVRLEDYTSALNAYEKAATLAPGIAGYRLKEALVLFQLKKSNESKKLLEGLVRKYPSYSEAHAALAAVLWSEGNRSVAEDQLNRAAMSDSKYNDIRWMEATLQWPPMAIQAMEKLLSLNMKL